MIRALPASAGERCWARIGVDGDRSCPELAGMVHCRNCPAHSEGGRALLDRSSPPGYLADWAERLADEPLADAADTRAILVFRVRSERFGIEAALAVEVLEPRPVRRVPHRASPAFLGLVNVGGSLLPCCDPAALLDVPGDGGADAPERLLVVSLLGENWVLAVDEIAGLRRVPETGVRPLPSTVALASGSASGGLLEDESGRVTLLDERRLAARLREALG